MKRDKLTVLNSSPARDDAREALRSALALGEDTFTDVPDEPNHAIDHERARALILEQTRRLLPPPDANALADHLIACDRCFRFAQDVAAQEREHRPTS